jgi:hypothetical protein
MVKNGLLPKENGSIEPWIFDQMAMAAVDRIVSPAHGSTVDYDKGYPPPVLIRTAHVRSQDPGGLQAASGGEYAGTERGVVARDGTSPA